MDRGKKQTESEMVADEKPYSDSLTWQRVTEWPPWRCPRCQHLPDDEFAWVTGDALPRPAKDQQERYDATLLWGDCMACGEALYRLEITLLPHRPPRGWIFQNDDSWHAHNVTRYRVSRGRQTWNTYHVRHPQGVRWLPVTADGRAVRQGLPWLDIHVFEPLWADDQVQAFTLARKIVEGLKPTLLSISWEPAWPGTERNDSQ
jgi:hypothetical protein